jgi:phenylacetate-CoA ligase
LGVSQYWSQDEIRKLQYAKLRKLLIHAYQTTTYYKQLFDNSNFVPEQFATVDELKRIPFLTKNIIRSNNETLLSSVFASDQLHSSETGGTTGVKMQFFRNNSCLASKEASRYRFEQWTGWDFGERMGLVWTAQQDYVGHWTTKAKIKNELFERQVVLPAAILDDVKIESYLQLLVKKKPTMIRAFSSPIYEVARVALKLNMNFPSIKGIVTTGEPLYQHQRQLVEKAFGCKVLDSYRCREVGPIAQECVEQKGLHINSESLFVEVVPPAEVGVYEDGTGDIVVTDLLNFGMPLIRYKIGDMGILSSRKCDCGRGLPMLEQICGRSADNLRAVDGRQITAGSLVLYLVDEAPGSLGQVQIIQDKTDHLIIRMTPDPPPTERIKLYQVKVVKQMFGEEMNISFEIVDEIKRGESGKYQFAKYQV